MNELNLLIRQTKEKLKCKRCGKTCELTPMSKQFSMYKLYAKCYPCNKSVTIKLDDISHFVNTVIKNVKDCYVTDIEIIEVGA